MPREYSIRNTPRAMRQSTSNRIITPAISDIAATIRQTVNSLLYLVGRLIIFSPHSFLIGALAIATPTIIAHTT
jgi:hypothetical protein